MGKAGRVEFVTNQLASRDVELSDRFEHEIEEAVAAAGLPKLRCRILAWQRGLDVGARDRVTVLLHGPGWVKALGVSVFASATDIRRAVEAALSARACPGETPFLAQSVGA